MERERLLSVFFPFYIGNVQFEGSISYQHNEIINKTEVTK